MKESDLLGKKPWVYIDLDGVLADLFGHATNVNQELMLRKCLQF